MMRVQDWLLMGAALLLGAGLLLYGVIEGTRVPCAGPEPWKVADKLLVAGCDR